MVRIVDTNHFDLEGVLFFFLSMTVSLIYGIGLRGKNKRFKLAAVGLVGISLVISGVRIAILHSEIDFLAMREVSRFSFYGAHLSLLFIGIISMIWRKDSSEGRK
jgi:heme/copper-type cytochrome/quinol oxidase subunit 3